MVEEMDVTEVMWLSLGMNIQFSHLLNNVGIHNDKKRYVYKDN